MLKELTLAAVVLLILAGIGTCQEKCRKGADDAPAIMGLKLGMPVANLQAVLGPTIKFKRGKNGSGSIFQNFIEQPAPDKLKGVRALYVRYFNDRVFQIEVFYEDGGWPARVEDFVGRLSNEFDLPILAWTIKNGRALFDCGGFTLTADTILNPHLELTDVLAYKEFKKKHSTK